MNLFLTSFFVRSDAAGLKFWTFLTSEPNLFGVGEDILGRRARNWRWGDPNYRMRSTPGNEYVGRPSIPLPPDTERSQEYEEAAGTQFPSLFITAGSPRAKYELVRSGF